MALLRRLHTILLAFWVKWHRTRYVLRQFKIAHAEELTKTPVQSMPMVLARQSAEIASIRAGNLNVHGSPVTDRKSWQWPFLPSSVRRLQTPIMKMSPYNLRRLSRTPVARRAMNMIKGALISLRWDVRPIEGVEADDPKEQQERIKIARKCLNHPNNDDSFQSWLEQCTEDYLTLGGFVSELGVTLDPQRPLKLWPVNVESIRLMPGWTESTVDMPRYVQMTGLKGERGALAFYDDEILYLKDNPSTDNPFGLGKMEVAFQSLNDLLGVQGMAGRAGTDQVHKTWLWWPHPQPDSAMQIVRRHIQNDLEGQAKISLIAGAMKPDVVEVTPVNIEDLLIPWQEMLIRMVANGFDMSAMALGIEHDINRAVGEVLSDKDFRTAVVPTGKRIQEGLTRRVLHNKLNWYDLEFVFTSLEDPDLETMLDMCSRLYSMNATTPNIVLGKIGWAALDSPYANLTQFESMLLNIEAQEESQNDLADKAQERQQKAQEQMPQQPGLPAQSKVTPGSVAKGGQPPSPKPMSLPKFPIQGTGKTAKQVAMMPVNQVQDVFWTSRLKASSFVRAMDEQEPGILERLSNEVKDFLQERLDEEQNDGKSTRVSPKLWKKWEDQLKRARRKDDKRTNDLSEWMRTKAGQTLGKPGTSNGRPGQSTPMRASNGRPDKKR